MKKIMFSEKFGLTKAVLSGRKTQTRRVVSESLWDKWTEYDDFCGSVGVRGLNEIGVAVAREYSECEKFFLDNSPFKVGEVVAVAQSYKDAGVNYLPEEDDEFGCYNFPAEQTNGWTNKMFVRADLMPHQIRITNVRVERLQDISDEDCLAEGVCKWTKDRELFKYDMADGFEMFEWRDMPRTPREAYAALIDKISGKGTWEANPYVFVYEFELIK
ncbi:hypothetical protein [Muribaculum intestinale]|uniref:hypothetical protein n=1 Tax=Muribaculum intestinale TaxID=1796646 RepID=UPI00272D4A60|nr:hypothetical protein [Muribaculum intestinale]